MKRLNNREFNLVSVTKDLFLKGSPERRIAEYAYLKGFTDEQFSNFLDKLDSLSEDVKFVIHTHFRDIKRGECFDKARCHGENLRIWIEKTTGKKTNRLVC